MARPFGLNLITNIIKMSSSTKPKLSNVLLDRLETRRHFFFFFFMSGCSFTGEQFPGCLQMQEVSTYVMNRRSITWHYVLGLWGLINEGEATICSGFWRANQFNTGSLKNKQQEEKVSVSLKFRVCLISSDNSPVSSPPGHNKDNGVTCDMSFHYLDWGQSITRLTGTTGLY